MTTKKLLTGVALAALLSGGALAQTVAVDGTSGVAAGGEVLAAEIDLSSAGQTADLVINLDFTGPAYSTLGASDQVDFTVDLTGFEFDRVITSGDIVANGADPNCAFSIQAGGGDTGTSVTFRSTGAINACVDADVDITLPIEVTANNANFSWQATLVGPSTVLGGDTNDSDGGTAGDQPLVTTAQEFSVAVNDGFAPADLLGPDFILFGVADNDQFGSVEVIAAGAGAADLAAGVLGFDTVATDNNTVTINLVDATGIAYIEVDVSSDGPDAGTDPQCVPAGTTCVVTLTGAELAASVGAAHPIFVVSENNAANPIQAQALDAAVALEAEAGFSIAGISGLTGDLDPINRDDGLNTDVPAVGDDFEWVSVRSSGGTNNAFRVSGLPTNLSETGACIEVQAGNTNTTIANAGWNCVNATVVASADGTWTATFGSAELNAALGAGEGNADVQFRVRRDEASGADGANNAAINIRRLLARSGIVTGTGFDN